MFWVVLRDDDMWVADVAYRNSYRLRNGTPLLVVRKEPAGRNTVLVDGKPMATVRAYWDGYTLTTQFAQMREV